MLVRDLGKFGNNIFYRIEISSRYYIDYWAALIIELRVYLFTLARSVSYIYTDKAKSIVENKLFLKYAGKKSNIWDL